MCPILFSVAVINTRTKSTWGGYGLFNLVLLGYSPLFREIGARTQVGQTLEAEIKKNVNTGLILCICSTSFLIKPRVSPSIVNCALPHNQQLIQFTPDMATGLSALDNHSIEISSQITLDYFKLTIETEEDTLDLFFKHSWYKRSST